MTHRPAPLAAVLLLLGAGPLAAAPRDEALRLAPPDAALVLVLQDARGHVQDLSGSPFAAWFAASDLGKQLGPLKAIAESARPVFDELGVTPDEILNDIVGDAVVFAFTPAPPGSPKDERAVLLLRPRKPETLSRLVERLNAIQTKNGEVKEVTPRRHEGEPYFERRKPGEAGSEFYCFRGGVFAFSSSEADIRAVIDRDRAAGPAAGEKPPELTARLIRLGVRDSLFVVLVNPRAFDAEVKARVTSAKADEKPFLERFAEVWAALDAAAVYLDLGADLEAGVSVKFRPDALPGKTREWLAGPRVPPALWAAVPENALLAGVVRFRPAEFIETVSSLLPEHGKAALKTALEQYVGPVVGKDRLPAVLGALGPDLGVWAVAPPEGEGFLPVAVAAVQVSGKDPEAARSLLDAVDYGFRTLRVVYNAGHTDQITLKESKDGAAVIRTLVNAKGFPPGFEPSFALKGGYLLLATSPDAIRAFTPPTASQQAGGEVPVVRFSASATRAYLLANRAMLAKFLADTGAGSEKELLSQIEQVAAALAPLERVELLTRGDADGMRLALRVRFVKPLRR